MYLSELIDDEYTEWRYNKVFIAAPTGVGKTTFIINKYLNRFSRSRKKLLILCNRKLLREQYWYDLIRKYKYYSDITCNVTIATYQSYTKIINGDFSTMFEGYDAIVCDEAHYFISDSDFNGLGTYSLLQAIVRAGIGRTMIFMTATPDPVFKEIAKVFSYCYTYMTRKEDKNVPKEWLETKYYDYSRLQDYSYINCILYPNDETLIDKIANSTGKTIIFIEDKVRGEYLKQMLVGTKKIHNHEISILNADNLEEDINSDVVSSLTINHTLPTKVLVTTAVLDNGVSIHDLEVENVIIETESEITFKQMLGRIRKETVNGINLLFVMKDKNFYKNRMLKLRTEVEYFEKLLQQEKLDIASLISDVWSSNKKQDEISMDKKAIVFVNPEANYYCNTDFLSLRKSKYLIEPTVNRFAYRKISDLYAAVSLLYIESVKGPEYAIYKKLEWINILPDECSIEDQEYKERERIKLIDFLLKVKNLGLDDFTDMKKQLVNNFKHMFSEIPCKNGSLENEKLILICKRYGLKLQITQIDRKQRYTVCKEEQNVNDKNVDE